MEHYLSFFLLCLLSTFLIRSILHKKQRHNNNYKSLPPSPPALPLIGHLHYLSPLIHKSLQNLSSKYGPLLFLRLGFCRCILVSSPSIVEQIFKTQGVRFASRPPSPFEDSLVFGSFGFMSAPYGDYWRFMNKLSMTKLLSTRQIERSRAVRREEISAFLTKMIDSGRRSEVVDMSVVLMELTNNIICRMVMGRRCSEGDEEAERFRDLVKRSFFMAKKLGVALLLGPSKKFVYWYIAKEAKDLTTSCNELLERLLKEHENECERENKDLMHILLEVYRDDKAEFRITRTQMKAIIVDLMIAGTSTAAETMKWTIAELINHPNILNKVRQELDRVVGRSRLVQELDIQNLPYLQAVVKEALRLHPPTPFIARLCPQHCRIQGFNIPENTLVAVNPYAIMRDPTLWDQPNEFLPDRFFEVKARSFNYIPFGSGRRACPGMNLAYAIMNIAIASMVQCFDLKVGGDSGGTVSMEEEIGIALAMASPLKCLPVIHFNPFST